VGKKKGGLGVNKTCVKVGGTVPVLTGKAQKAKGVLNGKKEEGRTTMSGEKIKSPS